MPLDDNEKKLADKGETIWAVKAYRDRTGHSLTNAKAKIDKYRARK